MPGQLPAGPSGEVRHGTVSHKKQCPTTLTGSRQAAGGRLQAGGAGPGSQKLPEAGIGGWQAWLEPPVACSSLKVWMVRTWQGHDTAVPGSRTRVQAG